ncbi:MAG TPA: PilZ domain-containing protein [Gemmataceae bacterium]|nr:PilZ domain-containing protein [Gemmataceae bacterium]
MLEKTFSFWHRLVGKTPQVPAKTAEQDRRLWVRYAADLRGNIQLPNAGPDGKILAQVRDLSLGGANVELAQKLELGQMLTLELAGGNDEVRSVLACVVRVTSRGAGKWSVGCVFSRELTGDDLERFGAKKLPADDDDKRTWIRYHCELKANYRKVDEPVSASHSARVLNISANGIGLSVKPSLNAGSLLNVELLDRQGRPVRSILACVVHTTERSNGDAAIGCNFIRELREEELQSLL